jgi:beta-galactosidase/beta-glucuronidase
METPWSATVTAGAVLDDYPRPQMVRERWLNLNGRWRFAIRARSAPVPDAWDGEILVPFPVESSLSGVARAVRPDERLWYERELTVPVDWAGQRILLHFGAVDFEASVWLNGGLVGVHRGGFDPFSFDVTDFLRPGKNVLVVGAWDPTSDGAQPRGKQHLAPEGVWYTAVTGIWQTVWVEPVPSEHYIAEVRVDADTDGVDVAVMLDRPTTRTNLAVRLVVSEDGREIASRLIPPDRKVRIPIVRPRLWAPEHPFLYDLTAELVPVEDTAGASSTERTGPLRPYPLRGAEELERYARAVVAGDAIDAVRGYFGMRLITVGPHPRTGRSCLLLNGEPVFHLGTLDQGWWPDGLLTPPSDDAIVFELEYLKAAGFNTVRKHIKVEPDRYYHHCDRLGVLVWQDMPSAFVPAQFVAPNDGGEALKRLDVMEQQELEMRRIVGCLGSHPSIVMWVVHNEGWGQYDTARLARWLGDLDPGRLVNAASGWLDVGVGDVRDRHDYAEAPAPPKPPGRRALVLGEFGGIGWPVDGHLWDPAKRNWGYQTYAARAEVEGAYRKKIEAIVAMWRDGGLSGAIYTQTSDVEGEVNGLLTYDRRVEKLSPAWLRSVHAPLLDDAT